MSFRNIPLTILSATDTLDFPEIPNNGNRHLEISLEGAEVNDSVIIGAPSTLEAGLIFSGFVSATGVVTIRVHNSGGSPTDPAPAVWRVTVVKV